MSARRLVFAVMLASMPAMLAAAQPPAPVPQRQARLSALLVGLQAGAPGDGTEIDKQREQLVWQRRVFDERCRTLSLVFEVPARIEQRLFALTRTIQQSYQ